MEFEFWVYLVFFVIFIVLLYLIYRMGEEEKYLGLKLFGYSFLGAFPFRMNDFSIPIGFFIYLLFFHPKVNKVAKRRAALLGLAAFFAGAAVLPSLETYFFERPREVAVANFGVYPFRFSDQWKKLKEELDIGEDARLFYMNILYASDGQLKKLSGEFFGKKDREFFIIYSVEYDPETNKCKITRRKSPQPVQKYDELVTMNRLFEVVDRVKEKNLLPHTLDYFIHAEGRMDIGKMTDKKVYLLDRDGNLKLDEYENLPMGLPLMNVKMSGEVADGEVVYYYP